MAFKLVEAGQARWRAVNAPHLVALVRAGARWLAVLTLIENEAGADRVEELLRTGTTLLPFVVGLETYYVTLRETAADEAERRLLLVRRLPARWLDSVDDAVLMRAGRFKVEHRLSLADCLIAAFAAEAGAVLVHKDPEYDALSALPRSGCHTRGDRVG